MKWKKRLKNIFFALVFLIGIGVIIFPIVSQWAYYQASHTTVTHFEEEVAKIDRTDIDRRIKLAEAYNASLYDPATNGAFETHDPFSEEEKEEGRAAYAKMLEVNRQIGVVNIPKISEKLPIYAGTTAEVLQRGAGHLEGSSLPVGGANTHAVITAHRGLPKARLFTELDKLTEGDRFFIENIGGTLAYEVDDIKVIEPTELDALRIVPGKDYVTLLTCTPYMINSHRLLVRGHRIPYTPSDENKEEHGVNGVYKLMLYVLLAFAVLFLIIYVIKQWRKRRAKAN